MKISKSCLMHIIEEGLLSRERKVNYTKNVSKEIKNSKFIHWVSGRHSFTNEPSFVKSTLLNAKWKIENLVHRREEISARIVIPRIKNTPYSDDWGFLGLLIEPVAVTMGSDNDLSSYHVDTKSRKEWITIPMR